MTSRGHLERLQMFSVVTPGRLRCWHLVGKRLAMLLTACQALDGPRRQNYRSPNINSVLAEKRCPRRKGDTEEAPGALFLHL